jgi:hypothetical protein
MTGADDGDIELICAHGLWLDEKTPQGNSFRNVRACPPRTGRRPVRASFHSRRT